MLTRQALAQLSDSLRDQSVLSIYLDGRASDPAARKAWRSILSDLLAALRDRVEAEAPDEQPDFDRCLGRLEEEMASIDGALSAPGFAAFVAPDRMVLAETLPVAMPNVARWRHGPWISPYLRAQKELRPVLLAVVDARSARSYRYALGVLTPLEQFHAHVQVDQPTHMGSASRQFFHTGTRGATTTDAIDRAREHGTQRMLRELIDHLMRVATADEWIVVGGMPMRAGLVLTMLPTAMRQRAVVATGLTPTTATSTLRRIAREHARRLRQRIDREIVEAAIAHAAERGRGSVGPDATRAALSIRDVHTLLLSTRFMNDQPELAEELARLALAGAAAIEIVSSPASDRLDRSGGVAAILRYVAPATAKEPAASAVDSARSAAASAGTTSMQFDECGTELVVTTRDAPDSRNRS